MIDEKENELMFIVNCQRILVFCQAVVFDCYQSKRKRRDNKCSSTSTDIL